MTALTLSSRLVIGVFAAIMVITVVAVVSDLVAVSFLLDAAEGQAVDSATAYEIDQRQSIIGYVQVGLNLLSAVLFLVWFYHSEKHLKTMGVSYLNYSPTWAVGGFFVPLLNLVRPYQVMAEVWAGSRYASTPEERRAWSETPFWSFVGAWWVLFWLMRVLGSWANSMLTSAYSIGELIDAMWVVTAADFIVIPAAAVTLALVRRITRLQEEAEAYWHPAQALQPA